jgi:hypothetical protein
LYYYNFYNYYCMANYFNNKYVDSLRTFLINNLYQRRGYSTFLWYFF